MRVGIQVWLLAALVGGASGCRRSETCSIRPADAAPDDARVALVIGETDESSGWAPIAPDADVPLVHGAQGGWMIVVTVEVPPSWADEPCVIVNVVGTVDGTAIDPISVRLDPAVVDGSVRLGPVPVLLGFDPTVLDGRALRLTVWAISGAGRAEQTLSVVLRR